MYGLQKEIPQALLDPGWFFLLYSLQVPSGIRVISRRSPVLATHLQVPLNMSGFLQVFPDLSLSHCK